MPSTKRSPILKCRSMRSMTVSRILPGKRASIRFLHWTVTRVILVAISSIRHFSTTVTLSTCHLIHHTFYNLLILAQRGQHQHRNAPEASTRCDAVSAHRPQRYCGLRPRAFWSCVLVLVLVVVAIAVGTDVGVSKRSASLTSILMPANPTATRFISGSPMSDKSSPSASPTPDTGGCKNGIIYTSTNNTPFVEVYSTDLNVGPKYNPTAVDWNWIPNVGTFHGCNGRMCSGQKSEYRYPGRRKHVPQCHLGFQSSQSWDLLYEEQTALIGSSNKTAQMMHPVPRSQVGLQSAYIIGL
jgi:hypothetical protein